MITVQQVKHRVCGQVVSVPAALQMLNDINGQTTCPNCAVTSANHQYEIQYELEIDVDPLEEQQRAKLIRKILAIVVDEVVNPAVQNRIVTRILALVARRQNYTT